MLTFSIKQKRKIEATNCIRLFRKKAPFEIDKRQHLFRQPVEHLQQPEPFPQLEQLGLASFLGDDLRQAERERSALSALGGEFFEAPRQRLFRHGGVFFTEDVPEAFFVSQPVFGQIGVVSFID